MRRRLVAAVLALGVLLTAAVSPAAAYYATGYVPAVHCELAYTIDTHYHGTNHALLQFFQGDPYANCHAIEVDMKWAISAGNPVMTDTNYVYTPDPVHHSYYAEIYHNGYYCVAVQFTAWVAYGANVTTGWLTC